MHPQSSGLGTLVRQGKSDTIGTLDAGSLTSGVSCANVPMVPWALRPQSPRIVCL